MTTVSCVGDPGQLEQQQASPDAVHLTKIQIF